MCRNLILLAQNERQQMVFTCEHGTIHITHQKTTICLASEEFRQFTHLLAEGDLPGLKESNLGSIHEGANQQVELWVDSGGLRLHPEEFFSLAELLRTALWHFDRLPHTVFRSARHKHFLN